MLTIKRELAEGDCVFCGKTKEVVSVAMEGEGPGEILLCWADVKKLTRMKMRVNGKVPAKPSAPLPSGNSVVTTK